MGKEQKSDIRFLNRCLSWLSWFCPPQLLEGIEGDLAEQYQLDAARWGVSRAKRRLVSSAIRFLHYEIILRNKFAIRLINTIMLASYIRVAARNIQKRKLYSVINAFGLSIGIAFCMLIWLFVRDERSFDQFHENKNDIVVLECSFYNYWNPGLTGNKRWERSSHLQTGLLPELLNELPEIERGTRINTTHVVVKKDDRVFAEDVTYVDGDFFRMFSFPLIQGSREKLFSNNLEVVITPKIASKYFDGSDPIGEILVIDDKSFVVAGIIEPAPANSTIEFQILISQEHRAGYARNVTRWGNFNTVGLVQLRPGTDRIALNAKINRTMDKHFTDMFDRWRKEGNLPADQDLLEYATSPFPERAHG
jgi:putative ABC transport system permease protein